MPANGRGVCGLVGLGQPPRRIVGEARELGARTPVDDARDAPVVRRLGFGFLQALPGRPDQLRRPGVEDCGF